MQILSQIEHATWPCQTEDVSHLLDAFALQVWPEEDGTGRSNGSQACVPVPDLSQWTDSPAVLLQITTDVSLGRTRAALLAGAGFRVLTIWDADTSAHLNTWNLRVILFCHTVRRERALKVCETLREKGSRTFTARLTFDPHLDELAFDAVLPAPVEPSVLMHEAVRWKHSVYAGPGVR